MMEMGKASSTSAPEKDKRWAKLLGAFGDGISEAPQAQAVQLKPVDQSFLQSPSQESSEERRQRMMDVLARISG